MHAICYIYRLLIFASSSHIIRLNHTSSPYYRINVTITHLLVRSPFPSQVYNYLYIYCCVYILFISLFFVCLLYTGSDRLFAYVRVSVLNPKYYSGILSIFHHSH